MINYSAFDYLCINLANAKGMDKELFETRIQWVKDNFHRLEEVDSSEIDEPILYIKASKVLLVSRGGILQETLGSV